MCRAPTRRLISHKESNAKSRSHRQVQRAHGAFGISHTQPEWRMVGINFLPAR